MAVYEQIKRTQFIFQIMRLNRKYGLRGRPIIDACCKGMNVFVYRKIKYDLNYN